MALAVKLLDNILQFGTADVNGIFTPYTAGTTNDAYVSSPSSGNLQFTAQAISIGLVGNVANNLTTIYGGLNVRKSDDTSNVFTVANATGNTTIAGTLGLSGKATFSNDLQVNGNTVLGDANTDSSSIWGDVTFNGAASATSLIASGSGPTTLNLFNTKITTANVLGAANITMGLPGTGAHVVNGLTTTFQNGSTGSTAVIAKAAASQTASFDIQNSSGTQIASIGKTDSGTSDLYIKSLGSNNLYINNGTNAGLYVSSTGKVGIRGLNSDSTYLTLITGTTRITGATLFDSALTVASNQATSLGGQVSIQGTMVGVSTGSAISLFDTSTSTISLGNLTSALNLGNPSSTTTIRGNLTVAADKNLTLTSGVGVLTQTHTSTTATTSFSTSHAGAKTESFVGASISNTATTSTASKTKTVLSVSASGDWNSANNGVVYGAYISAAGGKTNYSFYGAAGEIYNANNVTFASDLAVNGGSITTTNTTGNLFNTNATTLNIGGAANVAVNIGANGGAFTVNNPTATFANATTVNINGASPTLASSSTGTLTLFNTNIATVNAFGAATAISLGNTTNTSYVSIKGTKPATAVDSAALVVAGGMGVAGKAIIGGAEDLAGDLTFTGSGTASIASNKATVSLFDTNAVASLSLAGGTGATSISIGTGTTGSAQSVVIGNTVASGITTIQSPTTNFTGLIQANNGITLAANKSLALASGTGQVTQTFTGTTTTAQTLVANSLSNEGAGVSVSSTSTGAGNIYLIKAVKTGSSAGASYGVYSSVSGAGTSVGGYFSASGGTNNYAIQIPAGSLRINDVDIYSPSSTNLSVTGNMTVSGNLTINGTTTVINTQQLAVSDNLITLNSDYTSGAPSENAGIEVKRGSSSNASFIWNETDDRWTLDKEGAAGTLQPVATRVSAPLSTGVLYWDDSAKTLSTGAGFTYASNILTAPNVVGSTSISSPTAVIGSNVTITGNSISFADNSSLVTPASTSASTKAISIVTGNATVGPNLSAGTILLRSGSYTESGTSNIEFWTGGKTGANDYAIQIDRANNIKLGAAGADTSITHVSGTTTAYNLSLEASSTGLTSTANGGNLILKSGKGYGATGTSDILLQTGSGSAGHTQVTRVKINATGLGLLSTATADKYLFIKNTNTHSGAVDRALSINVNEADRTLSLSGNVTVGGTFSTTGTFSSGGNFSTSSTVSITGAMTLTGPFSTSGTGGITITNGMGSSTTSMTLPALASDTLVSRTSTDTLTNKTLTSPKINEDVALTTTATSLNILNGLTAKTGTGTTVVYNTSPAISTSITSVGADFSLADNASGVTSAFAAASSVTIGGSYTTGGSYGFATGATASGTKTVNIGTGGTAGTTTINLGSSAGAGNITSNQDFVIASGKNFTVTSGVTNITSNATTSNAVAITANAITSGNALSISSSSAAGTTGALLNLSRTGALSTSTTAYGIKSSVTTTGSTVANVAGYFNASGATVSNFDIVLEHGTMASNVSDASSAFTLKAANTGNLFEIYSGASRKFAIDPDGAIISSVAISGGDGSFSGDLAVNGTTSADGYADITTTNTVATVFNTNALTLNAFGVATTLNLGAGVTGTTAQSIGIGGATSAGQVTFGSTKDYTSASNSGVIVSGGMYIAKQLAVNTNLIVNGNATLGNSYTEDSTTLKSKLYLQSADASANYYNIITPTLAGAATITLPTTSGRYIGVASNASGISDIRDGAVGLTSYTVGDILYYASGNSLTALGKPASTSVVTNNAAGSVSYTAITNANTSNAIVQRDGSGGFSAGAVSVTSLSVTTTGDSAAFNGNVTITGNLTVNGTATTISTTDLEVKDVQVTLNSGATTAANSGLIINRGTGNTAAKLLWNETGSPAQVWQIDKEGAAGTMQAIATRADSSSMTDAAIVYWDATNKRLVSDSILKVTSAGVLAGTTFTGALSGNATTASNFNSTRRITINGVSSTSTYSDASSGTHTLDISGVKVTNATQADTSTNLNGGLVGSVPYQSAAGATTFVRNATATSGFLRQINGTAPTWAQPTSAEISDATDANTASTVIKRNASSEISLYKTKFGLSGQADKADIRWNDVASALEFVLY